MRQIDEYVDLARERNSIPSDNKLSALLGIAQSSVSYWRRRRNWPGDDVMLKLAQLAGIPPEEALVELNVWRSGPEAQKVYLRLLEEFKEHPPSH